MICSTFADNNFIILYVTTGEGQYGKVYTCINVDTGELMAMKEVCSTENLQYVKEHRNRATDKVYFLFLYIDTVPAK